MEGLSQIMTQIFRYTSENESQINTDGYKNYSIDEENELITYEFDLKSSIRLDMLLNSIGVIQISGGQALFLITKIIEKCDQLKKQNLTHKSMTSDKIWLVLDNESGRLNTSAHKLKYKIYFTGYGQESTKYDANFICQEPCSEIISILKKCSQKGDKLYKLQQLSDDLNNLILKQLSESNQVYETIKQILSKYGYSKDYCYLKSLEQCQKLDKMFNQTVIEKIQQVSARYLKTQSASSQIQLSTIKQENQKQQQKLQNNQPQKQIQQQWKPKSISCMLKEVKDKPQQKLQGLQQTNIQKVQKRESQFNKKPVPDKHQVEEPKLEQRSVKQQIIKDLIQQLNFENNLIKSYFASLKTDKKYDPQDKFGLDQYKIEIFQEIKQEKIERLRDKFRTELIDKLDEALKQEFKITQSLISDEMLKQIINQQLEIEQLMAMNSINATQQYLRKYDDLDTLKKIKDKLKNEHKQSIMNFINCLSESLL